MSSKKDGLTTFRIRLPAGDVATIKDLARVEACKRQQDISWCELVRWALAAMVRDKRVVE